MAPGPEKESPKKANCLSRASNAVVEAMENGFYKLGGLIGRHPWRVILVCVIFVLLCVPGIPLFFYEETRGEKLWVPSGTETLKAIDKVNDWFPSKVRRNNLLITADNVLEPNVLQAMLSIDQEIKDIEKDGRFTWETICARLGSQCWSNSLLELWSFDEAVINALTKPDILDMVNSVTVSPYYQNEYKIELVLGEIERDAVSGDITGAKATSMLYVLATNETSTSEGEDKNADDWEKDFLDIAEKGNETFTELYRNAVRSFGDVGGGAIMGDLNLLAAGYILIIAFVAFVLGRFNMVQHRVYLSLCGVLCVGLSIAVSFGLCSYFQADYGPLHSILPFLLIGIGVDDLFVIVQAWETLRLHERSLPIPEKIALTVKHAGVSITVTSLTDILAFGIGATTVIPALRSFCIYASVGILSTFILQATFLVACLTLDQRRASTDRDACCCCYIHKDFVPSDCSQKSLLQYVFDKLYSPFLLKLPVKIIFFIITLVILAAGCYGVAKLEQDFDPVWFLPTDSYAYKYSKANDKYFPSDGYNTGIYIGPISYYDEWDTLIKLHNDTVSNKYTAEGTVESWYVSFDAWLETDPAAAAGLVNGDKFPSSEANFNSLADSYISTDGRRYSKDVQFTTTTLKSVSASRMTLQHRSLEDASEEIAAMDSLRDVAADADLGGNCFAYSFEYISFETNKIIKEELFRNLGLAFICIFIMILILIANLWTCILVSLCVIMAVVDVGGSVFYWGLTIDTVTTIQMILAIGLAIDYSAHIGHSFMTITGDRNSRVANTLHAIGPAVFHGGFSTFLAFVMLAGSTSYVFTVFFKVFFSVVVFGLFHGLVFLPILLSWVGPAPYNTAQDPEDEHPHLQTEKNKVDSNGKTENGHANPALKTPAQDTQTSGPDNKDNVYENEALEMDEVGT